MEQNFSLTHSWNQFTEQRLFSIQYNTHFLKYVYHIMWLGVVFHVCLNSLITTLAVITRESVWHKQKKHVGCGTALKLWRENFSIVASCHTSHSFTTFCWQVHPIHSIAAVCWQPNQSQRQNICFSLATGGCQMATDQSLSLCDWSVIHLMAHCHASKIVDTLL